MTRIVVDPDELKRVAGYIAEASDAYSEIARKFLERPRPSMPERLATAIDGGLQHAHDALQTLSGRLAAEAYLLRTRASIVESGIASNLLLGVAGNLNERGPAVADQVAASGPHLDVGGG